MRIRRVLLITSAGIGLIVILALVGSSYYNRKQTPFQNAPKLINALQSFSRDQTAGGWPLPPEISLQELLRGGYLTTNDVGGLAGMEVTFNTKADEGAPQTILARARTPDGQFIYVLSDGSAQAVSQSTHEVMNASQGLPGDRMNGSQPFRLETNSRSPVAGSRH